MIVEAWNAAKYLYIDKANRPAQLDNLDNEPRVAVWLLKHLLPSDEMQQYIIGDLLEEHNQFPSRRKAYFWLYKQIIKSVFPLIYKTIKSYLLHKIGKRIL